MLLLRPVELGELGPVLGHLAGDEHPRPLDLVGCGAGWRDERPRRIGQHRGEPCDVEPRQEKVACDPIALCRIRRGIELHQHLACLDGLSVMDVDGADDPDLERLNHLGPLARNDLARGRGDDLDMPDGRPGHGENAQRGRAEEPADEDCENASEIRGKHRDEVRPRSAF